MDAAVSGRGAQAQFRHGGKVVSQEAFEAAHAAEAAAKRRQPKFLEEEVAWKGGLAQKRAAAEAAAAMAAEVRAKYPPWHASASDSCKEARSGGGDDGG
jgi:hypothetical protein